MTEQSQIEQSDSRLARLERIAARRELATWGWRVGLGYGGQPKGRVIHDVPDCSSLTRTEQRRIRRARKWEVDHLPKCQRCC